MLAPTLFPFFRHTISNVRLAVVKTLHSFMSVPSLPKDWIAVPFLRLLFQNLIVEERADIRRATLAAWRLVLSILRAKPKELESMLTQPLQLEWYAVLMMPLGMPLDVATFYDPLVSAGGHDTPERHNVDKNMLAQDLVLVPVGTVLCARVSAATALAHIVAVWPIDVSTAVYTILSLLISKTIDFGRDVPPHSYALH